jgi:hypothetical protein
MISHKRVTQKLSFSIWERQQASGAAHTRPLARHWAQCIAKLDFRMNFPCAGCNSSKRAGYFCMSLAPQVRILCAIYSRVLVVCPLE